MWREFVAEISARGWRAFVYGPEVHLALPILYGVISFTLLWWLNWRDRK